MISMMWAWPERIFMITFLDVYTPVNHVWDIIFLTRHISAYICLMSMYGSYSLYYADSASGCIIFCASTYVSTLNLNVCALWLSDNWCREWKHNICRCTCILRPARKRCIFLCMRKCMRTFVLYPSDAILKFYVFVIDCLAKKISLKD